MSKRRTNPGARASARDPRLAGRVAVLAWGLVAAGPAQAASKHTERIEPTSSRGAWPRLEIHDPRGRILLLPGSEGRIEFEGEKLVEAARTPRAEEIARLVRVRVQDSEDVWRLDVELPEMEARAGLVDAVLGRRESVAVDLRVRIPSRARVLVHGEGASVEARDLRNELQIDTRSGDVLVESVRGGVRVEVASGDVRLHDVDGAVQVESASGGVRLRRITGVVRLDVTSGDVDAEDLGGDADVETLSGDLHLWRCAGRLRFSTASGSSSIAEVRGSIDVQSASGRVDIDYEPAPGRDCEVQTASGRIEVGLPGLASPLRLDAFTAHGSLAVQVPGLVTEVRLARELRGRVGEGPGARLRLRSASGSIRVSGADARPASRP